MNESNFWIDMIAKLYTDLHMSLRVMHTSRESDKKRARLYSYFERLDRVHNMVSSSKSDASLALLKKFYYDLYVVKPENIPESYFESRRLEFGEVTDSWKSDLVDTILDSQRSSLDEWLEYFLFDDNGKNYEMWEKYWAFQGVCRLGKFDRKSMKFSRRDKTTVYPFPPLDKKAIFNTLKLMEDYAKGIDSLDDLKCALGGGNFKALYEYSLKKVFLDDSKRNTDVDGKWVKYPQGSDYNLLRNSLLGYYTGWCTEVWSDFAKKHLRDGDFYVYYSIDKDGEYKIPRIAIRMNGHDEIREIRGISSNQDMEDEMLPILNKKLGEFPDGYKFFKKESDMIRLKKIMDKQNEGVSLSKEELRFLYEIDCEIEGFGMKDDLKIKEIRNKRNIYDDFSLMFDCDSNEISLDKNDVLSGKKIKVFIGNLCLDLKNDESLYFPEVVVGSFELNGFKCADGASLPKYVFGNFILNDLENPYGLVLPENIGGDICLGSLKSADGVLFPESVDGNLDLGALESPYGLVLPKDISGNLNLSGLKGFDGLALSENIGGILCLDGLESAYGLNIPQNMQGSISLNGLKSALGLVIPKNIEGCLYLNGLEDVSGLNLPKNMKGSISLKGLKSAFGLNLPETILGSLSLDGLESASGLVLPLKIGGTLSMNLLEEAENLKIPDIGGDLYLKGIKSALGIEFLGNVCGTIDFEGLRSAYGLVLPEMIGGYLYVDGLESPEYLLLPEGFDIGRLVTSDKVRWEIYDDFEKFFRKDDNRKLK